MAKNNISDWNSRFSAEEYVYGTLPNEFYKEQLDKLTAGRLLLIAEGEGRNAVYAAKNGWKVDAMDFSEQARLKALALAERENVKISYTIYTLNEYTPETSEYDAVGIVFVHIPEEDRKEVFTKIIESLKPDGQIIMEVFSVNIGGDGTGGPKEANLLYSKEKTAEYFAGLQTVLLEEKMISLDEGPLHKGERRVIRYVGIKK